MRLFLFLALMAGLFCVSVKARSQGASSKDRPTLFYIPHTHWEGAVFKTREEYLDMGLSNIMKAVHLLKKYPDYKFTLDQVAYFRPFLERYPEEAAAFRKFVKEGRLQIVGGMDVMPDDVKSGGELFVRQMLYGKQYCREQLGIDVTVSWMLDTFGHHPQIPQLLKLAGFKSFWFCRGVPTDKMPSEFLWRGIDGTDIPAFWIPGFYGLFYGPPDKPAEFTKFFKDRFNYLNPFSRGSERVGLAGVDVSEPEGYVPPLVEQFNRSADAPFTIHYSVPTEFESVVSKRKDLPVFTNDLNPIFQGTYSSRAELKQITREVEQQLLTAEKLSAVSNWLGVRGDDKRLADAWEPVLFNQTHDLASGVMTDHVYEDVKRGYDIAAQIAKETTDLRWDSIAARIDTRGDGIPVVVFNTLGWRRTDLAQADVGFADRGCRDVEIVDSTGKAAASQFSQVERYEDGTIKRAKVVFVARDVPSMGYATYHLLPKSGEPGKPTASATGNILENDLYRVTVDRETGAVTSVFDKTLNWEALSAPGNVISRELDKGDLWELYKGLDGGSYIAMTTRQAVPKSGSALLSIDFKGKGGAVVRGPVYSEFSVSHPLGNGSFATRVRVFNGIRRIEFITDLTNNEKYVRYQALFPTSVKDGKNVQEIPFGAVERPAGIEFPAQQWVDYGDGKRGVALLNAGMPGNVVTDGTLMLSLLRSHNLGAYGFGGGYEPGMSSESGFQIGQQRTFRYALVPHEGDWKKAGVFRSGLEFNHPLLARKVAAHAGSLPPRWGMLEISQPNIVLTAFKPGPGKTTVLRVYEASGKATSGVKINLRARVTSALEANLLEDSGRKLKTEDGAIMLDFHPFEIKTIKVQLTGALKG